MKALSSLFLLLCLSACTSSMKLDSLGSGQIEKVDYKNYILRKQLNAYVGQAILTRKSFDTLVTNNQVEALNSFILKGGIGSVAIALSATKGDKFYLAGKNEKGNSVARIPNSIFMFGITPEGRWDNTVMSASYWTSPIGSGGQYKMEPATTLFKTIHLSIPLSEAGYINHELIFTGVGANGITLLYREYTFENNARSAFSQELVYPVDSKKIRFRNYLINIYSVNASELTYSIESE